ncbi:DEAD/DEAH box helicase [Fusibacter ferrireducens]|uniref:Superfamily I DNA and/or RNA helicase n=1 Tax=Fusibacter ferrireducens TaxID=2785058 RepID=A0ABR9ZNH8_9FIRM|nr:AAA domain-containing protein [Fusibacter ferrireducens]MBF4692017.1 hypothetical protein [Fusibacter ferrireducens]
MIDIKNAASKIIDFWYTIELLTQEKFPQQDAMSKKITEKIRDYSMNQNNTDSKGVSSNKFTIYSTLNDSFEIDDIIRKGEQNYRFHAEVSSIGHVCYGKVFRENIVQKLYKSLRIEDKRQERETDTICLFSFKRNADGDYESGSLQLSPLVWGVHQCHKNAQLEDKDISHTSYKTDVENLEKSLPEDKKVCNEFIDALYTKIYTTYIVPLELQDYTTKKGMFVYSRFIDEKVKEKEDELLDDVSNLARSFYASDLMMISEHYKKDFESSGMSKDLLNYITHRHQMKHDPLSQATHSGRINIRESKEALSSVLSVENIALGKWPSKYNPALMQQVAINYLSKAEDSPNIFSVNGPPGTGKTTLLKEIIAHNIVERAIKLVTYEKADEAFGSSYFHDFEGEKKYYDKFITKYYYFKDDAINDHSMLVASNNNAAVENITIELPNGKNLLAGIQSNATGVDKALNEIANLFDIAKSPLKESYWEYRENPDALNDESAPKKKKIEELKPDIFFSWLAHKRETGDNETPPHLINTWGLISAPLGKKSNIKNYYYNVLSHFINDALKYPTDCVQYESKYTDARHRFNKQLLIVQNLKKQLICDMNIEATFDEKKSDYENQIKNLKEKESNTTLKINKLLKTLSDHESKKQDLWKQVNQNESQKTEIQNQTSLLKLDIENCTIKIDLIKTTIDELKQEINFIDKILFLIFKKTSKYTVIENERIKQLKITDELLAHHDKMTDLKKNLNAKEHYYHQLSSKMAELDLQIEKRNEEISEYKHQINNIRTRDLALNAALKEAIDKYLKDLEVIKSTRQLLDDKFWTNLTSSNHELSTDAQMTNPWVTSEFNREREKLFYYALQLHKYFILSSNACRCNFNLLGMMWGYKTNNEGEIPTFSSKHKDEAYASLLSTLFLLTPVISTTFASTATFLKNIKAQNSIGLLIVDEAGQATPQIALGALWRSRKAIIVGDPKQVEPVVTSDSEIIMKAFSNDLLKSYQDKTLSVQMFADAINPIGSWIKDHNSIEDNESGVWVGCPLVVHRRCTNPMFGLSNELSYGKTMKYKTQEASSSAKKMFIKNKSCWLNIGGREVGQKNHYVVEQGKAVLDMVKKSFEIYKAHANDLSDTKPSLYIISPFTTVVNGIRSILKANHTLKSDPLFDEWLDESLGTVHKFQGKEANEVIFVLGCDKDAMGAVYWVSKNILNVAATRARYRFYIIGDQKIWTQSRIFLLASNYFECE